MLHVGSKGCEAHSLKSICEVNDIYIFAGMEYSKIY